MILQSRALQAHQWPALATAADREDASLATVTPHHRRFSGFSRLSSALLTATISATVLSGCNSNGPDVPVIGSPEPTATAQPAVSPGRPAQLRARWNLSGIDLPSDWPDVPVPRGTQVASAYAVDSPPRRTWTASFVGDKGTALELAQPVADALTTAGYQPVSAYTARGDADAGLFGFTGEEYSVYLVLGELDGNPNILMTVRQTGTEASGVASPKPPRPTPVSPAPASSTSSFVPAPTASGSSNRSSQSASPSASSPAASPSPIPGTSKGSSPLATAAPKKS